jgi:hypothetical protein
MLPQGEDAERAWQAPMRNDPESSHWAILCRHPPVPVLVSIDLTHVSREPSTASPPIEEPAGRRVVRRFPLPSIQGGGHPLVRLTWGDRALERSIWTAATPRPVGVRCDVVYASLPCKNAAASAEVACGIYGSAMVRGVVSGESTSRHRDFVCDKLDATRLVAYSSRSIYAVNALPAPGPASACEVWCRRIQ